MSNYRAIATVTAALRVRLQDVVHAEMPSAGVTTLPPAEVGAQTVGVNIFLYQAHINPMLRNRDQQTRGIDGALLQNPVVPVDLDYMLSFHGDQDLAAHQLLGLVMRSMHARPWLTPAMIAAVDAAAGAVDSGLAAQTERVAFTPLTLSIEELSKLWSVFFQTSYALSIAYRASVVLIEAALGAAQGPPVLAPQVGAGLLRQPAVTRVAPVGGDPQAPITAGASIAVTGERLGGAAVAVLIDDATVMPDTVADTRITLTLPATVPAGPRGLRIRQDMLIGDPPVRRPGSAGPLVAFTVSPEIAKAAGGFAIAVDAVSGAGTAPRNATVTVTLVHPALPGQVVALSLLDQNLAVQALGRAADRTAATTTVAIPVTNIPAGRYAVRLAVDGAETAVALDGAAGSPTAGQLIPQAVIP